MSCVVFYSTYPHAEDGEPGQAWSLDSRDWSPAEFDAMLAGAMLGPSDCIWFAGLTDPNEPAEEQGDFWIVRPDGFGCGAPFACAAVSEGAARRLFRIERPDEPIQSIRRASAEEAMAAIIVEMTACQADRTGGVLIPGDGKGFNGIVSRAREIVKERADQDSGAR